MKLIFLLIPGLLPLLLILGCGDTYHGEQNEPTEGIVVGYFQGEEALTGGELWRTDGTPQNTYLVFIRKLRMKTIWTRLFTPDPRLRGRTQQIEQRH